MQYPITLTTTDAAATLDAISGILNDIFALTNPDGSSVFTSPTLSFAYACTETFHNLAYIIDAALYAYGAEIEVQNLEQLSALSLPLTPQQINYIFVREVGISQALAWAQGLSCTVSSVSALVNGAVVATNPGWVEGQATFNFESLPSDITVVANIPTSNNNQAAAWQAIATEVLNSGQTYSATIIDMLNQMTELQNTLNVTLSMYFPLGGSPTVSTSSSVSLQNLWNFLVAQQLYTQLISYAWNNIGTSFTQNANMLKYTLKEGENTCATFIFSQLSSPTTATRTATLKQGQSLMDVANQALGDYTQWSSIANFNGLIPPYTSPISSSQENPPVAPTPGIAYPGQTLTMPGSSVSPTVGNYLYNFLGADINFGQPLAPLESWNGDFSIVIGYQNLTQALTRRALTELGTLIYHPSYGSGLGGNIGGVLTVSSLSITLAGIQSSFMNDPRVASIVGMGLSIMDGSQVNLTATVAAAGGPARNIGLNIVLQAPGSNV